MNITIRVVLAALFWIAPAPIHAAADAKPARTALVIGNSRYETAVGALRNTVNDAKAMAKALRGLGFTVIEKHNVTRDELLAAMMQFHKKLRGAEVGLFYFSGHGIQVSGANYLLPVKSGYDPGNVDATTLRLLAETKLFNAEQAVADMSAAGATCNLVILDACRSTPVARDPQARDAAGAGGLSEMKPPAGSLIAFATDAGRTASDGKGVNGLYTDELLKHLRTPGLSIEQVFKRTRAGVMKRSDGAQIPAEYSRLVGDDVFLAGPAAPAEENIPKGRPVPVPTLAEINKLAAAGDAERCVELLCRLARNRGAGGYAVPPFEALLENAKEKLRDAKERSPEAESALKACDLILSSLNDCVPQEHTQRALLAAKAHNRRGDALLLLGRADDALEALNAAATLRAADAYIFYNRGRAHLALGKKEEAKTDFAAAADTKFKQPGARKLALAALAEIERTKTE